MNRLQFRFLAAAIGMAGLVLGTASSLRAQIGRPGDAGFSIVGAFDNSFDTEPATISARFFAGSGGDANRPVVLAITVRVQAGWHVYSITQPRGGPQRTKIEVTPSPRYQLLAPFRADRAPKTRIDVEVWVGLEIQEHEEEVTWYAPVELAAGVDPAALEIRGLIDMQVCEEQCIPIKAPFSARLAEGASGLPIREEASQWPTAVAPLVEPTSTGNYQAPQSVVRITGRIEPATVRPGETTKLILGAEVPDGWHVYAYAERDAAVGNKPTLIVLESTWGLPAAEPATAETPIVSDSPSVAGAAPLTFATGRYADAAKLAAASTNAVDSSAPEFGEMPYDKGPMTWKIDINVPKDAEPGAYPIAGVIGYQACESGPGGTGICELPKAARFQGTVNVVDAPPPNTSSTTSQGDSENLTPSATTPYDLSRVRIQEPSRSLLDYIALAFVGGLILNLMPCVLPVIGLKVMSFVEQAGKSRGHALALNLWYAAGIVSVFVLLGVLAVAIGLSWGGQFGNTTFNVIIAAIVFAMALSLLGVWEVPIPGFFGSGAVQEAAAKEGPLGAFLKGVVTTVFATPCTAPFMASAVAWAVSQSTSTTLIVFATLGVGMASPYLVVGVFPELLRFLPKPGAWMLTFKQITGFILLGTVVFILSFIEPAAVVPTVLLLVGIGMACWLVARTPLTAEVRDRLQTWAMAGAVLLLFGVASFGWLYPDVMRPRFGDSYGRSAGAEGWDPFSLASLQKIAVEEGRTVIVDFSASWCFNCKVLEKAVLHTDTVVQAIDKAGAAMMYADNSDEPPEIQRTLKALKSNGVPVIAVFPGGAPYEPIVFRGGYSKPGLIDALQRAAARGDRTERPPVAEVTAVTKPAN